MTCVKRRKKCLANILLALNFIFFTHDTENTVSVKRLYEHIECRDVRAKFKIIFKTYFENQKGAKTPLLLAIWLPLWLFKSIMFFHTHETLHFEQTSGKSKMAKSILNLEPVDVS